MDILSFIISVAIWGTICGCTIAVIFFVLIIALSVSIQHKKRSQEAKGEMTVGFFHPYCNAGGGGERVLWCAVRAIQLNYPRVKCIVYTGDCDTTPEKILAHAKDKFNIELPSNLDFVFLKNRAWVEACHYPYVTLLGQSIGSMVLAYEAICAYVPDVFIDSMGYPFSYFIFKSLAKCKVGCYVHYPTISTDMLSVVSDRTGSFNNRPIIANSTILTNLKLLYYNLFAWSYGKAGSRADVVIVNSTWTKGHIECLWGHNPKRPIVKIFPPCDVKGFLQIPLERPVTKDQVKKILSISQFRPEKNHKLQVKSFALFLSGVPQEQRKQYKLVMAGGCRNEGDKTRVEELKSLSAQLGIAEFVDIKINISFAELKELLSSSHIGIHTMNNEHFGIGVVEFQAAGIVALAHNSGGPKMDIVIGEGPERTGFLAKTDEEYSEMMKKIFSLSESQRRQIVESARLSCERFSESNFEKGFLNAVRELI